MPASGDVEKNPWTLYQGQSSSCTCHSSVAAFYNREVNAQLSPRFAFKRIKTDKKYASSSLFWGAYMRDSLLLKINEGICEYTICPNAGTSSDKDFLGFTITSAMEESAKRFKGGSYIYVTNGSRSHDEKFDDIVRFMAEQNDGVKVGMTWRPSFNDARRTGIVPVSAPSGDTLGHDMYAVAWKRINGHEYLGFRNSFGKDWGDKGRIWIPKGILRISSAIAYISPEKPAYDDIIQPAPVPTEQKDVFLEQSNAQELRKMLLRDFPLDVNLPAQEANMVARALAGKWWLVLPKAVSYRGWTITDVKNWLYAQSRNKTTTIAYSFDFTKQK